MSAEASVVYRLGRPTAIDYAEAIRLLQDARDQTEPDGRDCVVCGDCGHQAWECHHNPLVIARRGVEIGKREHWRCFHCGLVFSLTEEGERAAREHFGKNEDEPALCRRERAKRVMALIAEWSTGELASAIEKYGAGYQYDTAAYVEWLGEILT